MGSDKGKRSKHVDAAALKDFAVNEARTDEEEAAANELADKLVEENRRGTPEKR